MEGLELVKMVYDSNFMFKYGFFGHVALTADGKFLLGHAGSGDKQFYDISPCYHPDKYLRFLKRSEKYFQRCQAIRRNASLDRQQRYQKLKKLAEEIVVFVNQYIYLRENEDVL
ncbi:hypothetical protein UABAM_03170 [Candidatus Uabimicrobium amorphum]|uniref:Uncharacterized protein n=2 Tax=Uabimicrobium amorphum TaxID=2596890 RepID=A0A5S9IMX7_UABAM|nr:hypothetical protein UABAM_03170 [Candidatus Uabimicrobium amorphum]